MNILIDYFWIEQFRPVIFDLTVYLVTMVLIFKKSKPTFVVKLSLLDISIFSFLFYSFVNELIQSRPNSLLAINSSAITYLFIYFIFKYLLCLQKGLRTLLTIVVAIAFFNCSIGIFQLIDIFPIIYRPYRVTGIFNNPAEFAGFLVVSLPLLNSMFKANWISRKYYLYLSISFILFIVIAESRAAILCVFLITLYELNSQYKIDIWRKPKIVLTITIIGVVTIFGLYRLKPRSADGRLLLWRIGLTMTKTSPLTGLGGNQLEKSLNLYQAEYLKLPDVDYSEKSLARNVTSIFNEPLRILIEEGILGICFILLIAFSIIHKWPLSRQGISQYVLLSIFCYVLFSFFSYPTEIILINLLLCLCLAYYSIRNKSIFEFTIQSTYSRLTFLIITVCLLTFKSVRFIKLRDWKTAEESASFDNRRLKDIYDPLTNFLYNNPYYLHNYFSSLANAAYYKQAIELFHEHRKHFIPTTELFMQLGNCYLMSNHLDEAERYLKIAESITPALLSPKFYLLRYYIQVSNPHKAKVMANSILETPCIVNNKKAYYIKEYARKFLTSTSAR